MASGQAHGGARRSSQGSRATVTAADVRAATAYALVLLGPAAAWLAWISWSDAKASDAMHVAWFASVAVGCFLAGVLSPRALVHFASLTVIGVVSTMATLFLWWSSRDSTGLFVIGIALATLPVIGATPVLLLLGRLLSPFRSGPP